MCLCLMENNLHCDSHKAKGTTMNQIKIVIDSKRADNEIRRNFETNHITIMAKNHIYAIKGIFYLFSGWIVNRLRTISRRTLNE